jgi:hydrogenase maturation protease
VTRSDGIRCLILACGNSLRGDDGVGLRLAEWAAERFHGDSAVRVIARQQWAPELAEDIASAESVLFIDSSMESAPGRVSLIPVAPDENALDGSSHHLDASKLLGLARALYHSTAAHALILTVGAGSVELGETFSRPVEAALPRARRVLEKAARSLLAKQS